MNPPRTTIDAGFRGPSRALGFGRVVVRVALVGGALVGGTLVGGLLFGSARVSWAESLRITEVAARPTTHLDANGDASDWIELSNSGVEAEDLGGYALSNSEFDARLWVVPDGTTVEPGERLVVFASGENATVGSELHASFSLSDERGSVLLSAPDGSIVDALRYPAQTENVSFGRFPDPDGPFQYLLVPSPGKENTGPVSSVRPDEAPEIDPPGCSISAPVDVALRFEPSWIGLDLRYTLDGSEPIATSFRYERPIRVRGHSVLRAAAFAGEHRVGRVATETYLAEGTHSLDVLSLVTAPTHLFDPASGILENPEERGPEWERPRIRDALWCAARGSDFKWMRAFVFTATALDLRRRSRSVFTFDATMDSHRSRRASSTRSRPSRSSRRSWCSWEPSSPRSTSTYARRLLLQPLFERLGQPFLHHRPVSLYLNGEYWGLYFLLERPDEHFARSYFGAQDWDVIEGLGRSAEAQSGDRTEWTRFFGALERGEYRGEAGFERLGREVDLDNVTAYLPPLRVGSVR